MSAERPTLPSRTAWACLGVFVLAALGLYYPALNGTFISDDLPAVSRNPYIQDPSFENLVAILDPFGPVAQLTANYAPVHMLAHAAEWQLFGMETFGFHVVNVLSHAVASTLLVLFFVSSGIARPAAILLGALFLVHPANVEAVAWIFQLKTSLALAFSLGALLLFPGRPALALALFALALLTKITAAYALPLAALGVWVRGGERGDWQWLGVWALVALLCAIPELAAFQNANPHHWLAYTGVGEQARSIVAIASRYLVMSFTTSGVSAFHEPGPAESLLDGWFLSGLLLLALLSWRWVVALRRRSEEAVYWTWALVSFAPVSQVFTFIYPMADRYLYFILPGLLGGAYFLVREALERWRETRAWIGLARGVLAGLAVVVVLFAAHAAQRTPIWRFAALVDLDAARNYPGTVHARLAAARSAAQQGDFAAALASLESVSQRGFWLFDSIQQDPGLEPIRGTPEFQALVRAMADRFVRSIKSHERLGQSELRMIGRAHLARGDAEAAARALHRALEHGGLHDDAIRSELRALGVRQP